MIHDTHHIGPTLWYPPGETNRSQQKKWMRKEEWRSPFQKWANFGRHFQGFPLAVSFRGPCIPWNFRPESWPRIPGEMIQFDLRIVFKWGGSTSNFRENKNTRKTSGFRTNCCFSWKLMHLGSVGSEASHWLLFEQDFKEPMGSMGLVCLCLHLSSESTKKWR